MVLTDKVAATPLVTVATFQPSPPQLRSLIGMLAGSGLPVLLVDNSVDTAHATRIQAACAAVSLDLRTAGGNPGTAGALNLALLEAHRRGLEWLLYFDQDSRVDDRTWQRVLDLIAVVPADVAAVGCTYQDGRAPGPDLAEATHLIASGTLFRVSALLGLGGFDEALALDLVDHEICIRLRAHGWRLLVDRGRRISHQIGSSSQKVPGLHMTVSRHPSWRRRLMWRNSILLVRRHFTSEPRAMLRHLMGRILETVAGSLVWCNPRYFVHAAQGLWQGLRVDPCRRGLVKGPDGNWQRPASDAGRPALG